MVGVGIFLGEETGGAGLVLGGDVGRSGCAVEDVELI